MSDPKILWKPKKSFTKASTMDAYRIWVNKTQQLELNDYQELWNWSVNHQNEFWESILNYYQIDYSGKYKAVKTTPKNMHETRWFQGIELSYAEHIFKNLTNETPAIVFKSEHHELQKITWESLLLQTGKVANYLKSCGVKKGDRVCSMLPNSPEAIVAFLATNSLGGIWTSCSPDFGIKSILDRFSQIEPKVFIAANAYQYNGKIFNKIDEIKEINVPLDVLKKVMGYKEKFYIQGYKTFDHESSEKIVAAFQIPFFEKSAAVQP